jgi:hypothetical protein
MNSQLKESVIKRDEEAVKNSISSLEGKENWSLVTVIDELLPLALMESNLRFGNFHSVKMALFLRRLAVEGYFSKVTEREIARVIALELVEREWVSIHADRTGYTKRDKSPSLEEIVEELNENNVHNAFYYAIGLLKEKPKLLLQSLLTLGASAIPNSLGHSLSCFFPVVEDVIALDHPQADTALLSYIMYLSRHDFSKAVLEKEYGRAEENLDYDAFLKLCASGDGVLNMHHTITFYVATEWEHAIFNEKGAAPYGLLSDWIGGKEIDRDREQRAVEYRKAKPSVSEANRYTGKLPETYEEFSSQFSFDKLNDLVSCVFQILEEKPKTIVDWLFRSYASHYTRDWDPHYYTGLYSVLRLCMGDKIRDKIACHMALEQALHYFAEDIA